MTTVNRNEVLLEGTAQGTAEWSHRNHGTDFYRLLLRIPRLSGTPDLLPVLLPESLLHLTEQASDLRVQGQLRSFNNRSGIGNKLILTVYAQDICPGTGEPCNRITLSGTLCKPPVFRCTPLGRSICDLMLAVPRRYGRTDYLPVIAWGQLAVQSGQLQVGDSLALEGRIQSRTYHKQTDTGTEQRTAYEVSMMQLLEEPQKEEIFSLL